MSSDLSLEPDAGIKKVNFFSKSSFYFKKCCFAKFPQKLPNIRASILRKFVAQTFNLHNYLGSFWSKMQALGIQIYNRRLKLMFSD